MANDADMKDDLIEQVNTYMMSNMSPLYCRFNRGIWLSLEHLGRAWAKEYEEIYITSGAIFDFNSRDARDKDKSAARMGSRNQKARVALLSDYYKVFLRKEGDSWHSIAFLLEHSNESNGSDWDDMRPISRGSYKQASRYRECGRGVVVYPEFDRNQLTESTGDDWDLDLGKANFEASCP